MRASVAYEMLHDLGHLDPQLDPHLAYPQEFMVLSTLKLITSRPIIELYEGVMKIISLTFWTIFILLLYKFVFKDIRYTVAEFFLVGLMTALLLTFPPSYSSEMSYAYPLLVTIFYSILSKESFSKNLLVILIMFSIGVVTGSQRETFVLLMFAIITSAFLMLFRFNKNLNVIKIGMTFVVVSILASLQLLYNAQLYVVGYGDYMRALLHVLDEIMHGRIQIIRPPLHTVLSLRPPIDRWLNTIGATAFLTTLVLCGIIGLITFLLYIRGLIKKEINSDKYGLKSIVRLGITATFLVFSFIIVIQYVANILALWTIDFESTIPLIESTIVFVPIIGMKTFKFRNRKLKDSSKYSHEQGLFRLLLVLIMFFALFSPLGLHLRTDIRSYADVVNVKGNPTELTILANNVYNFLLRYNSLPQTIVLDSRFSGHYLYLPLKYEGFNIAIYDYHQEAIARSVNILISSSIMLNNGDYILYLKSTNTVYYIYDGEYVIMPY
jgi:hypothetical protein